MYMLLRDNGEDEGVDGANACCKLHPCHVMLNCTPSIASLRFCYSYIQLVAAVKLYYNPSM